MADGAALLPMLVCLSVVQTALLVALWVRVDEAGVAAMVERVTGLRPKRRGRDHL